MSRATTLAEYTYLGVGGVVKTHYADPGAACDFTFGGSGSDPLAGCLDGFGRVIQIPWIKSGSPIAGATYAYDRSSNRTQMQPLGYSATNALQRYSYDGVDRLTRLIRGAAGEMQGQEQWSLDATGNWRQYDVLDVNDASKNLAQSRQANRANEITDLARQYGANWPTPSYDRAGNTVTFPQPLAPTEGFNAMYDAWNRLITLTKDGEESPTATYSYDGLTRRVTTTDASANVRRCYYTASWQAIEERLNTEVTADRQFTWGLRYIDDEICRDRDTDADGTLDQRLYALQDANWNTVAVTSSSGTIQQRYQYSAYGQPTRLNPDGTPATGTDTIRWEHLYCGYRYDHETGLYLVRYRWLLPPLGRWLTLDADYFDAFLNLYQYVDANPLVYTDPSGLLHPAVAPIINRVATTPIVQRANAIGQQAGASLQRWWIITVVPLFFGPPGPQPGSQPSQTTVSPSNRKQIRRQQNACKIRHPRWPICDSDRNDSAIAVGNSFLRRHCKNDPTIALDLPRAYIVPALKAAACQTIMGPSDPFGSLLASPGYVVHLPVMNAKEGKLPNEVSITCCSCCTVDGIESSDCINPHWGERNGAPKCCE